ncbi:2-dehydropantoate 2-reductase [Sporodiniella umbellata]|nr:2-dehydropantoate 2-reductase [Sporodiniella umbellata]
MNIHILGTGAIGCHIAFTLKKSNHNVSLLLRSRSHIDEFAKRGSRIVCRQGDKVEHITGFEVASLDSHQGPITSLIVTTKAQNTLEAISSIAPYLSTCSSVLFLQNGMGIVDEVIENVWSKGNVPSLYLGVNLHGVERLSQFDIRLNTLSELPELLTMARYPETAECKYKLTEAISQIPDFRAQCLPWDQLYKKALKKLFANSSINAVAGLVDGQNKILLDSNGQSLVRSVCEEAWSVFKNDLPNESLDSMIEAVNSVVKSSSENSCSTLQDIRSGKLTEIKYINGYISKLGRERNVCTKTNDTLISLIHLKENLVASQ